MPYVKQEARPNLDLIVELMNNIKLKLVGDLSHILFTYYPREYTTI